MARARPARTSAPDQLTLDDWAKMLSANPETSETAGDMAASIVRGTSTDAEVQQPTRHHPAATELLEMPGALLTRTHLRELGLERRAVDAVFRALPVVALPGYSRPMIRADQYLKLVERSTYDDDRVRPSVAIMDRRPHGA
jgi:hypothetical protein